MDIDTSSLANRGHFLDLAQVIQVVAAHGFDDGLERHGATFGMGDGFGERLGRQRGQQLHVVSADRGENIQSQRGFVCCVMAAHKS